MNQALENPPNVVVECTKQKKLSQSFFVSREHMRTDEDAFEVADGF